ncbi:hypothetical protein PENSOL_c007G08326 [Penicillium solitum]|uniref:Uncharacterized protein n=1 Tax=Penicillium solitum TaxID=60172 RepID=A0A1V6RC93_9EURO|nr:uncharacterized protein PENSOL_c007G08326 [Penicillium solitum]OQD99158.1 hypothetical protein PENSOL_c007G08326 [Penicillium solitum]
MKTYLEILELTSSFQDDAASCPVPKRIVVAGGSFAALSFALALDFVRSATTKDAFENDEGLEGVMFIGDANHLLSPYEFVGGEPYIEGCSQWVFRF